jgi:hypothetical protein
MKKIIIIVLLLIDPICFLFGQNSSNENYIKLTYGGPRADMTIPYVAFSTKKMSSDLYNFGLFFKVRQKDFVAIKKAIENSKDITQIDTAKAGYYRFIIVFQNSKTLFKAINPEKANNVFDDIVKHISKPTLRKKISETFALIYQKILDPY